MRGIEPDAAREGRDAGRGEPHALDAIIDEGTLTIGWAGVRVAGDAGDVGVMRGMERQWPGAWSHSLSCYCTFRLL